MLLMTIGGAGIKELKSARKYWLGRLERAYQDHTESGQRSRQRIAEHISAINEAIAKMSREQR